MQQLIRDMRVGSKIILGKYSCNKDADPQPIVWLKASPANEFIAQDALDCLCFDARELTERPTVYNRYGSGNANYAVSNIHLYLNSGDDEWFVAQHPRDTAPVRDTTYGYHGIGTYANHYGFLKYFEDYEVEAILCDTFTVDNIQIEAKVRLPLSHEIVGDSKFTLFNRKGVRAHPSEDLVRYKGSYSGFDSVYRYIPYIMANRHNRWNDYIWQMDSGCYMNGAQPESNNGIRPVIKLDPCARVDMIDKGTYELIPSGTHQINVCSDGDFLSFLGLV